MFTNCPIASVTRRHTAAPALSPFKASSCIRIALSAWASSPYRLSIRWATPDIDLGITPRSYRPNLNRWLKHKQG